MDEVKKEFKPTFAYPEKMVRNEETGFAAPDPKESEQFVRLHAMGQPEVYYAIKANKYYRDDECTKEFTSAQVTELGLPTTTEIAAARKKLIDELVDKGVDFSREDIYAATAPAVLLPREDINKRLYQPTFEEQMINKLNSATLKR